MGYISRSEVKLGLLEIDKYKVTISKVISEHAGEPDKSGMFKVISRAEVLPPKTVCTDSYLIAYSDNNAEHVKNFYKYLCTKFFRFLLLQAVSSINLSKDKFCFIPMVDLGKAWTDKDLCNHYELSTEEIEFIDSMIKPMNGGNE